MNIIPQCALTGEPIWNVRLYDFLKSAPVELINRIRPSGFDHQLNDDSRAAKVGFGLRISRFLKHRPRSERESILEEMESVIGEYQFERTRMMSTDEIKSIAGRHEIGAHSFSHESMGFESDEFFSADLARCRQYFEAELDLPLRIYAFPNGSYRESQIETLSKNGIDRILLVDEDFSAPRSRTIKRFTIYGASEQEARLQALGLNRQR
jgi:hypothetical protein